MALPFSMMAFSTWHVGEELAAVLHQDLVGGMGDLVGAAAVEADPGRVVLMPSVIIAGPGFVDIDHGRDREAQNAGLQLGALEPLLRGAAGRWLSWSAYPA